MDHATLDTAPVRTGEELDLPALRRFLGALQLDTVEQFPGGHSNLTYLLRLRGGAELVLRRAPLGPVAPKAHDMVREFHLLAAVSPHFPPAPKPLLVCEDPSVLGSPFFIMERRQGAILRHAVPPAIAAQPDYAARISAAFVDCLARLHSIRHPDLEHLGKPQGFVERQVQGWTGRWNRARTGDTPDMDRVVAWLNANIPPDAGSAPVTLVHNDYKLDNVMLDPASIDRVEAVLDWEMATVGDPMIDVGLSLCYWCHASFSTFTNEPGWFTRDEFLSAYAQRTGFEPRDLRFHETLGIFKLAVILQQIYFRFRNGQTADPRFAGFGQRVEALTAKAAALAG